MDSESEMKLLARLIPSEDCENESCSVVSNSLHPHGLYSPWNSSGQDTRVGSLSLLQGNLPNPGIEPRSPALWADSLPGEPQGKPKNTGVGSLSLLQRTLPTQESNRGLLHCRGILYQPSYHRIVRANPLCAFLLVSGSLPEIFDIPWLVGNVDPAFIFTCCLLCVCVCV